MYIKMKKYFFVVIFIFVYPKVLWAETENKMPLSYLTAMTEAHKNSSYELLYILQQDNEIESFRLRHTFIDNKEYAQLLNLDHSREEIILKNQTVSYLGNNFRPFSLKSSHILDNLPSVLYTDYTHLEGYTFLDSGKDRISDRIARVIRIVPNDNFRYSYTLWIDEESKLLLKSRLYDEDNTVLEEFRVLQLEETKEVEMIANVIESFMLPSVISTKSDTTKLWYNWQVKWVPKGFKLIESRIVSEELHLENEKVDSQLYSDGLSAFTIYIMPSQSTIHPSVWQQGKLTILNQTINDKDIVIIGDVPLQSAKQIMKNIHFKEGIQP